MTTLQACMTMPPEGHEAVARKYGEGLREFRAHRRTAKIVRRAIDEAEQCCAECDWLDERYE